MAGHGPAPTPNARRRNEPTFDWSALPAGGRDGHPPTLPPIREWSTETDRWWRSMWSTPQAAMWDPSGATALPMAILYQLLQDQPGRAVAILGELRQHEDRHGLNPKAMLSLRWRIVADDATPHREPATAGKTAKARRLKIA